MEKNTLENLTNYIFSVQSLIDRLNIMQTKGEIDFTYINKRIEVIEKFEDKLILELGGIKLHNHLK